jgi:glutathione synthase/RimK-type ligase-like ATP-grasp enzyme
MKIAVLMDDIADINPKKDSSLAMMLEAMRREWEVYTLDTTDNSQQTNKEAYLDLSKQQPTICHQKRQPSHDYTQRSRRCNSHRPRLYQRSKH